MNEKIITINVEGMHCASCVATVERVLKKIEGVENAEVNLLSKKAKVSLNKEDIQVNLLVDAIENAGYSAELIDEQVKTVQLNVEGMHCASCVATIEKNLSKKQGLLDVKVNLPRNLAQVTFNKGQTDTTSIIKEIETLGYTASIKDDNLSEQDKHQNKQINDMRKRFFLSFLLTIPVFIFAMGHMPPFDSWFHDFAMWQMSYYIFPGMLFTNLIQFVFTTPIQFILAYPFYRSAWKSLKNKSASMEVLVVLGTSAAYFYSVFVIIYPYFQPAFEGYVFFETSAILLTFIFLGKYLEEITKGKTSAAIKKLLQLKPNTATVIRNGQTIRITIDDVIEGDICIIKPGESIPVDGKIVDGNGFINESMITGESVAVNKTVGEMLIGGTINEDGLLKMEATKVGENTTLNKIIKMVEEAQTSKLPIQKLVDKISSVFVPSVVLLAIITFSVWFILFQLGIVSETLLPAGTSVFLFAFLTAITVIVISCPCALGLATPTAIMVGTGLGAQNGILIRSGEALERARQVNMILFDKTGTITIGKPVLTDIISFNNNFKEKDLLLLSASLEQGSEHSIAKAIIAKAEEENIILKPINDFKAIAGKGIRAKIDDKHYNLGNRKLLAEENIKITEDMEQALIELEEKGKTAMVITDKNSVLGIIAISDSIKPHSKEAIQLLNKAGIKVAMVSGDNPRAAKTIAKEVGIQDVHADVLPEEKLEIVKNYQKQGLKVAFVGDGINDSPALAQANVGIAIGSGTDVAIESGDVVLVKDDLRDAAIAIILSRKTINKVKTGLFWAFVYNTLAIPIAAGILFIPFGFVLPPEIAGLAMALSSVSVVLNSLSLKLFNGRIQKIRSIN